MKKNEGGLSMYYGIVMISVIMFGVQFLLNDRYEKLSGNHAGATFAFSFLSSSAGFLCLLAINRFRLEWTPFTALCALASALNSLLYTVCSLKALSKINLSLYSLFSMLGGMLLPFLLGLIFYGEDLTVGKVVCVIFIGVALALSVSGKVRSKGMIYYIGIFILNGMSGVIAKLFESAPYLKTGAAGFSILSTATTALISGMILLVIRRRHPWPKRKAAVFALCGGLFSPVANFLLLIALAVLPASTQYPMVTGGVMIVSTVFAMIIGQKPSKRELLAVFLSFCGLLALVLF